MKRSPHILRKVKGNTLPHHVIVFDTETRSIPTDDKNTVQADLSFGYSCYFRRLRNGAWSEPDYEKFTDSNTFWNSVLRRCKKGRKVYIFAHNASFDFTVLKGFQFFRSDNWTVTKRIISPSVFAITYRKNGQTICLVDSFNLFRMSLAAVGDYVGYPKLDMPEGEPEGEDWDIYCKRDVEVLTEALKAWWRMIEVQDLGNFRLTLASQTMEAYKHRFMKKVIYIDSIAESHESGRKALAGGRTEAFMLGRIPEKVFCLDINSMYPSLMKGHNYPVRLEATHKNMYSKDLDYYINLGDRSLLAEVDIETDEPIYPLKTDSFTLFPVGKFTTHMMTPELIHAQEHGHIKYVHKLHIYEERDIFTPYVDHFWNIRQQAIKEGDEVTNWLAKMFLNNLYGKFSQRGQVWDFYQDSEYLDCHFWTESLDGQFMFMRRFAGIEEVLIDETESRDSFPAISAQVTSYGRLYLWKLIQMAGRENVFYCDTDSLMVNADGYDNLKHLIDPYKLGALKLEWESENFQINGLKDYVIDGKRKAKGIRKDAIEVSPGVFRQVKFRGIMGMLRDNDLDNIHISQVEKHLSRNYSKGVVQDSGKVEPLRYLL